MRGARPQLHSSGDWRSLVARFLDTEEVTGSSPVSPTYEASPATAGPLPRPGRLPAGDPARGTARLPAATRSALPDVRTGRQGRGVGAVPGDRGPRHAATRAPIARSTHGRLLADVRRPLSARSDALSRHRRPYGRTRPWGRGRTGRSRSATRGDTSTDRPVDAPRAGPTGPQAPSTSRSPRIRRPSSTGTPTAGCSRSSFTVCGTWNSRSSVTSSRPPTRLPSAAKPAVCAQST